MAHNCGDLNPYRDELDACAQDITDRLEAFYRDQGLKIPNDQRPWAVLNMLGSCVGMVLAGTGMDPRAQMFFHMAVQMQAQIELDKLQAPSPSTH
jgi:hypothetical protein